MKIKDMDLSPPPAIIGQPQVAPAPGKNFLNLAEQYEYPESVNFVQYATVFEI